MSHALSEPRISSLIWPDTARDRAALKPRKIKAREAVIPRRASAPDSGLANGQRRSVWRESLAMVQAHLPYTRRTVRAKETIYRCGDPFDMLYLINCGSCKILNLSVDGREQPVDFCLKGDWLGFDGIASARHACSAVALDSGELWAIPYSAMLQASVASPEVMQVLLGAMSEQLTHNRDRALSVCTLAADARVADFLLHWAQALAERDLRNDEIAVHMTRADIGRHLGITLESVSRAFTKMQQHGVIRFGDNARRNIGIPSLSALSAFVHDHNALEQRRLNQRDTRLPAPAPWRQQVRPC